MKKRIIFVLILVLISLVAVLFACKPINQKTEFTISFNTNGGSAVPSQRLATTDTLVLPQPPTKEGYVFGGWYTDPNCEFKYNANTFKINANATLYAFWIDVNLYAHDITIEDNGLAMRIYESSVGLSQEQLAMPSEVDVELSKLKASKNDNINIYVRVWKQGFKLKDGTLKANGELIENGKFLMPARTVTISFEIELEWYNINIINGANGTIFTEKSKATYGDNINLLPIPDYGYRVASVKANNADVNNLSFVMPAAEVLITATFEKIDGNYHNISCLSYNGVAITPSKTEAKQGEYIDISVDLSQASGYFVKQINVNGEAINNPYFVMPNQDVVIEAVVLPIDNINKYRLRIDYNCPNGSIHTDYNSYSQGELVALSNTPLVGYELAYYLLDSVPFYDNSFIMPSHDVAVSAVFLSKPFSVSISISGNGNIEAQQAAYSGDIVHFTVQPTAGYVLLVGSLKLNGAPINGTFFVMPSQNAVISAIFVPEEEGNNTNNFSINVAPSDGGTVVPSKYSADSLDIIYLQIVASEGYRYIQGSLKLNNEPQSFVDYFMMSNTNIVISAQFERIYKITSYQTENGFVVADRQYAAEGETVNITYGAFGNSYNAMPFANGESIYDAAFIMPPQEVALSATFNTMPNAKYAVTCLPAQNGTVTTSLSSASEGMAVSLTVTPSAGYMLQSLYYINYSNQNIDISHTFFMPSEPVGVRATFVLKDAAINPALFFDANKLLYTNNGGGLQYYSTPKAVQGFLSKFGLQAYTSAVDSILYCDYITDFVLLQLHEKTHIPYITHKILSSLSASSGLTFTSGLYGDYLLLSSCGSIEEDYSLLLSGITEYSNMLLYTRKDDSYGLLSLSAAYSGGSFAVLPEVNGRAITYISKRAFSRAAQLTELSLGVVNTLGSEALYGLHNIKTLELSRLKSIASDALNDCLGLTQFYVASYNNVYSTDTDGGYALYERYNNKKNGKLLRFAPAAAITNYSVQNGCEIVSSYAFLGAGLTKLLLVSVSQLADYALYGMQSLLELNTVHLTTIGHYAIHWNSNLNLKIELLSDDMVTATALNPIYTYGDNIGTLSIRLNKQYLLDDYRRLAPWSEYSAAYNFDTSGQTYRLVFFESNGGSYIYVVTVNKGVVVTQPQQPLREGYIFGGWYTDNNTFNNPYDFNLQVHENIRLYAKWTAA